MATETSDLLTAAAPPAVAVVRGIADDQLDLPTPCRDFTVRDLLNHLFQVVVNFQELAAKRPVDWAEKPDFVTGDWRDRFETETGRLIEAWSDPAALEGISPGMGMPQEVVGGMVLLDLTVHAWDLARATGQPFEPAPVAVTPLHTLATQLAPQGRKMNVFAEPVPLDDDATELDQLLGLTGRDPAWSRTSTN